MIFTELKPDLFKCVRGDITHIEVGIVTSNRIPACEYIFPNVQVDSYRLCSGCSLKYRMLNIALNYDEVKRIVDGYNIKSGSSNQKRLKICVPEYAKENIENVCKDLYEKEKKKRTQIGAEEKRKTEEREEKEKREQSIFSDLKDEYCAG